MIEQNKNTYPPVPVERFADTPKGHEVAVAFPELQELADKTGEQWQEEGFNTPRRYIDTKGQLVLVARNEDVPGAWRLLIDGRRIDTIVPESMKKEDVQVNLRMGRRRLYYNRRNIYDVRHADPRDLTPELRLLTEKFGELLFEDEVEPGKWVLDNGIPQEAQAYDLDIVQDEVAQRDQENYELAWKRAHTAERNAQIARQQAAPKLFRTAKRLASGEDAYRRELKRQHGLSDEIFK